MLQISPALLGSAQVRSHPLADAPARIPPQVEIEMLRLHRSILSALPPTEKPVVQFTGAAPGVGTTRVVTTLAEVVSRAGALIGSVDLCAAPSGVPYQRLTGPEVGQEDGRAGLLVPRTMSPSDVVDRVSYETRHEIILIDSPPIRDSALSMSLTPVVHGTVLVVQAERTTEAQIRESLERIADCGGRCIGIAFNKRRFRFGRRR